MATESENTRRIIPDLTDVDEVRRAIVLSEILGRKYE